MKKYSLSLLFLFCGLFLYGQQYVSVSPSSISVPLEGGTYTCSVDYTISPDSLMNMDFIRYACAYFLMDQQHYEWRYTPDE